MILNGKKIILGITGGIAAYKAIELARLFIKSGASVWPVMTKASANFITPLTLQTVTGNPVARDMFENKIVQANVERLKKNGCSFIGPEEGDLACGYEGRGRLAPVEDIMDAAEECLAPKDLKGEKVLVTAGPTREAIDPVRFISNPSSGRMGYAIARAARRRGAEVVLVSGPSHLNPPRGVTFIKTTTAEEIAEATMRHYPQSTVVIMAAAVSDYRPRISHRKKVKKEEARINIELGRTQDILKELGSRNRGRFLVGFALETENMLANAKKTL